MPFEDIQRKAELERQKEQRRNRRKRRAPKGKRFFPLNPDGFTIFRRIYPHTPHGLWLLIPLILATVGGTLWLTDKKGFGWLLPYAGYVLLVPVVIYSISYIREIIEYQAYKNWRNNLHFSLNGWERLGETEKFPRYRFWDEVTVTVLAKPGTNTDVLKLLDDVLYLFCVAASGTFYAADFVQPGASGDLRKKWQRTGLLEVSGSANSSVMGELYLCIHKRLRPVHEEYNCIEAVNIKYDKHIYEVQPVQVSD